jgi:uncharacterized repeat protein (TIGR03803 family)
MKTLLVTIAVILVALAGHPIGSDAQTLTTLWQFSGSDGSEPGSGLVQGRDGYFYGTTSAGAGTNYIPVCDCYGSGTVYRITSAGTLTTLYQFGARPTDGVSPFASLVQGTDGNFYSTTGYGGTNFSSFYQCDKGTVFRITPSGVYTTLWDLGSSRTDGWFSYGSVMQASDGNFYGTTQYGGANTTCSGTCGGTVFQITPSGSLKVLHSFSSSPSDGACPDLGVVQGADGYFYGATVLGGTNNLGTVFRMSSAGTFTTLYQFGGKPTDGRSPADVIQGSDGNFYGTTADGGTNYNAEVPNSGGTIFKITPQGTLTTLYQFGGRPGDGTEPLGGLVLGSDGNFYGTTYRGGTNGGNGTLFRISSTGTLTTLYQFGALPTDGQNPWVGLMQASDGCFYGTTRFGGTNTNAQQFPDGGGTVFKLVVPLNPPANEISAAHFSGTNAILSVPSVSGGTYQLQFSSSLNPTNWSNIAGASVTNSIGSLLTVTNLGATLQPQGFYRFDITPSGAHPSN